MTPAEPLAAGRSRSLGARILSSVHRVTALLRLVLIAPLIVLAAFLTETTDAGATVFSVWVAFFGAWALFTVWWSLRRPVPSWAGAASIVVDLAFFIGMAASSAGATSYITPVFYLYPVFSVFYYRPALTAVVGGFVAGGYAAVWLQNLAVRGGPDEPGIVWMHFLLLTWMALTTTALSLVLAHRARDDAEADIVRSSLIAQVLAADHRASTRLANDLHDGPLQDVIAVRRLLEQIADTSPEPELVETAARLLEETTGRLRGTVQTLHPQVLAELGLAAAVTELARTAAARGTVPVFATVEALPRMDSDRAAALFGACREFVANAQRHAEASRIDVTLTQRGDRVVLSVTDDGTGFIADPSASSDAIRTGHVGLASQQLRVHSLGGTMTVDTRPGAGTAVRAALPPTDEAATRRH
ncbi:sensor histidine kinase [Herbiconiux sp. YIM B11900]|uniref:sensor histidine kinase n=1 Tax=Herbiconiux sp. YIM B11900 TaxID=3404131 RepID=UPI003F858A47